MNPNQCLTVTAQNISSNLSITGDYECELHVQKFRVANGTIELEESLVPLVNNDTVDYFWQND